VIVIDCSVVVAMIARRPDSAAFAGKIEQSQIRHF